MVLLGDGAGGQRSRVGRGLRRRAGGEKSLQRRRRGASSCARAWRVSCLAACRRGRQRSTYSCARQCSVGSWCMVAAVVGGSCLKSRAARAARKRRCALRRSGPSAEGTPARGVARQWQAGPTCLREQRHGVVQMPYAAPPSPHARVARDGHLRLLRLLRLLRVLPSCPPARVAGCALGQRRGSRPFLAASGVGGALPSTRLAHRCEPHPVLCSPTTPSATPSSCGGWARYCRLRSRVARPPSASSFATHARWRPLQLRTSMTSSPAAPSRGP